MPMSAHPESNSNGFTAVNDRSIQNLAVKALGHRDWSHPNGDAAPEYQPYPATAPPKRRSFQEILSSPEEPRTRTVGTPQSLSPVLTSASSRTLEHREQNPCFNQAEPTSREAGWNGGPSMDEARMAELLTQDSSSHSESGANGSPGRGSQMQADMSGSKDPNGDTDNAPLITNAGLQVDMKKRKRAFTNRTKTGCQTCRKRKKKCDEGKPACNNCIRGGFTCLGYHQKRDVANKAPTVGRSLNPNIAPAATPARDYWDGSSTRSTPRGNSFDQSALPLGMQESRHSGIVNEHEQLRTWTSPNFHQLPRATGQDRPSLPPPFASRDVSLGGSLTTSYSPMGPARRALAGPDSHFSSSSASNAIDHERVSGITEMFQPTELIWIRDRERCRMAVASLNRALYEGSGNEEVQRRLRAVIQPEPNPDSPIRNKGMLGKEVWVEAPLHADYGYNLYIGIKVFIDRNCTFKDAGEIHIGDNTRIGPNTTICAEFMMSEPNWQSFSKKVNVRIGKNCVIAGNCSIYAPDKSELVIGDGVYIAPGLSICADVPPNSRVYQSVPAQPYEPQHGGFMNRSG